MESLLMFVLFSAFVLFPLFIVGAGGGGTSTKHKVSEGYQWAVLVFVAASEDEISEKSEGEPENELVESLLRIHK